MFFVTVLIGGRSSIAGPLIATIVLTVLPAIAAPLAQWSDFLYAVLLLVIVITAPGGIAALLRSRQGKVPEGVHELVPQPAEIKSFIHQTNDNKLILKDIELSFGGLKALDGVDLQVEPGRIHGLIGPNGSGKTTLLNVISGYYYPQRGRLAIGDHALPVLAPRKRAMFGLARTFQTPHVVGEISVLDNVMIGGSFAGKATLAEAMLSLPRSRREEQTLRKDASRALYTVGIGAFAETRTDRLQHSELRFLEIARALVLNPRFLLLDEPAAGLSAAEIRRLSEIVRAIRDHGIGVLLVEHHADLIFDICDQITVLNEGQVLARGTPDEIRDHKEVVDVYLGG
jgi:ABC-type branched-subunit amino acid transport system ATPase component